MVKQWRMGNREWEVVAGDDQWVVVTGAHCSRMRSNFNRLWREMAAKRGLVLDVAREARARGACSRLVLGKEWNSFVHFLACLRRCGGEGGPLGMKVREQTCPRSRGR